MKRNSVPPRPRRLSAQPGREHRYRWRQVSAPRYWTATRWRPALTTIITSQRQRYGGRKAEARTEQDGEPERPLVSAANAGGLELRSTAKFRPTVSNWAWHECYYDRNGLRFNGSLWTCDSAGADHDDGLQCLYGQFALGDCKGQRSGRSRRSHAEEMQAAAAIGGNCIAF